MEEREQVFLVTDGEDGKLMASFSHPIRAAMFASLFPDACIRAVEHDPPMRFWEAFAADWEADKHSTGEGTLSA